ncbi:hypothetical protein ACHAPJ_007969 [Fusarium lateritium]
MILSSTDVDLACRSQLGVNGLNKNTVKSGQRVIKAYTQLADTVSIEAPVEVPTEIQPKNGSSTWTTAPNVPSIGFTLLPPEVRLRIWEETWPAPRVMQVTTFWDQDPLSGKVYDFARFRFSHSVSEWLQLESGPKPGSASHTAFTSLDRSPAPIALFICKESREHTLKRFVRMLHVYEPWSFYFNPRSDVLSVSSESMDEDIAGEILWKSYGQQLSNIRKSIFTIKEWQEDRMSDLLRYFGGIMLVQILLDVNNCSEDNSQLGDELQRQVREDGRWHSAFQVVDRAYRIQRQLKKEV